MEMPKRLDHDQLLPLYLMARERNRTVQPDLKHWLEITRESLNNADNCQDDLRCADIRWRGLRTKRLLEGQFADVASFTTEGTIAHEIWEKASDFIRWLREDDSASEKLVTWTRKVAVHSMD